ncbi:MAG: MFS transporter, partial [Limisphaerales bacterium]
LGYRRTIRWMCLGFFLGFVGTFSIPRAPASLLLWLPVIGFFSGVFGLFTMYLPPLFPTLLRTTGAGFCYNIGRLAAALGTVIFGLYLKVDFRSTLLSIGFLFIPAILITFFLPELSSEEGDGALDK